MADSDRLMPLAFAVRGHVLLFYLGQLGLMLVVLCVPPLLVALYFGEHRIALHYVAIMGVLLVFGLLTRRLPSPTQLQLNEALTITALAFLMTPCLMSLVMMQAGLAFPVAFFEAVSAVTTTGLTMVREVHSLPQSLLFARAWMQWYGGLGVVVLSIALLMGQRFVVRRLVEPVTGEGIVTTTRHYARRMLGVYLVLTLAGLLALWASGLDLFTATVHVLSAVSTGGFSSFDHSLAAMADTAAPWLITLLALSGAVALPHYYRLRHAQWREVVADAELRSLLIAALLVSLLLAAVLHVASDLAPADALAQGVLMGFSAQTTSGFASMDVASLNDPAKALLILAMATGGSVGSTAGGMKILRLLIVLRLIQLLILRTAAPPHAVVEMRLGGRRLNEDDLARALSLVLLFLLVILLSWLVFLLHGYAPLDSLFEVVSATGTVGLSTGLTSASLPPLLQGILAFDMLAGRLEVLALLVVLYPGTWIGKREL